jgi:hypothetical protein
MNSILYLDMVCQNRTQCDEDEKCQHGICVVKSGGKCVYHKNCPKLETCTTKGFCKKLPCNGDDDCNNGKREEVELMCHPEKYCTGNF